VCPPGTCTRVGLVVPRFRHSAVARNQLKRRLRELSRIRLLPLDVAADVVIRIRPDAYRATFSELGIDMDRAIVQLVRWRSSLVGADANASDDSVPSRSSDT
jgi:ribonuclease P protein component